MGNLSTPASVRKLQRALHAKAKAEPEFRYYALYDKIYREDILAHAYAQCRSKAGASGVDGQDFADIEAYGVERWLGELAQSLRQESYRPEAVERVYIPKPDGGQRPLGIPIIRDRVCMRAAMLVLMPIFEADLPSEQYAYRPGRRAQEALAQTRELMGKLKLVVNENKTRVCRVPDERFDFLGYSFGRLYSPRTGKPRMGHRPSKRNIRRAVIEVRTLTEHHTTWRETEATVFRLNRLLRGWSNYFSVGTNSPAYRALDHYSVSRLSRWLRRKHKERRRGYGSYPPSYLYQTLGLIRLTALKRGVSWA